jgi:23S rRNA (cytosine1962-C5)-methyltransferase
MAALAGGATSVVSVDSSAKATALAAENNAMNGFQNHEIVTDDVFEFLRNRQELFDIVVLDPPAFAKHLSAVDKAMIGYRNLTVQGLKKVKQGGILFTFSCSQVIDKQLFRKVMFQAAAQSGRNVRILHQLSQGADHPISIYHPEGEYLKGLVLYVD